MMEIRVLIQLPARQNRVPLSSWPPHGHDPDAGRCVRWSVLWGAGCTGVMGLLFLPHPQDSITNPTMRQTRGSLRRLWKPSRCPSAARKGFAPPPLDADGVLGGGAALSPLLLLWLTVFLLSQRL